MDRLIQTFTRLKSSNLVKHFAISVSCLTSELWPGPTVLPISPDTWWSLRGSNPRPQHCQRCVLPIELRPHTFRFQR